MNQNPLSETQPSISPEQLDPQFSTPAPDSTNWLKVLLFIVLGLIIIVGAIYAGFYIGKKEISNEEPTTMQETKVSNSVVTEIPAPTTDPTEDWETHTNSELGFSFKYPQKWQIVQNLDSNGLLTIEKQLSESSINKEYCKPGLTNGGTDCYPKVSLKFSTKDKPIDYINIKQSAPCRVFRECAFSEIKYISLEKTEIRLEYLQPSAIYPHTSFIDLNSKILRIKGYAPSSENCVGECPEYTDSQEIIQSAQEITQILSTFKLIDQQSNVETENWKTYKNEQYKFEFKYPKDGKLEISQTGYVRIQNYTPDDSHGLESGEYYLEFNLPPGTTSCKNSIVKPETINRSDGVIYKGLGQMGGDAGGTRFALCAEKKDMNLYLQVTENNQNGIIANQILSTFEFNN